MGKWASTTQVVGAVEENLFPNSTGTENTALNDDYQLVFLLNAHGSFTAEKPTIWLKSEVAGGATLAFAEDTTPASPLGSNDVQAGSIANKDTVPATAGAFVNASSKATGLILGNLPPGYVKGIWIRRLSTNSPMLTTDGGVLVVEAGTPF